MSRYRRTVLATRAATEVQSRGVDGEEVRLRGAKSSDGRRSPIARLVAPALVALIAASLAACSSGNPTHSSIEGIPQQLTANPWLVNPSDSSLRYAGQTPITITFTTRHAVSGRTPCNTYRGTFTLDKDDIKITITSRTHRPTCGLEALAEYLSALRVVDHLDLSHQDRLVLTGVSNTRISYNKVKVS